MTIVRYNDKRTISGTDNFVKECYIIKNNSANQKFRDEYFEFMQYFYASYGILENLCKYLDRHLMTAKGFDYELDNETLLLETKFLHLLKIFGDMDKIFEEIEEIYLE